MTTQLITFDMVEAELAKLDRRKRNPMRDGTCLYTDPRNPARHCIVGQLWANLDVPVPGPESIVSADEAAEALGTIDRHAPGVLTALVDLQESADALSYSNRPWASAIDKWPSIRGSYQEGRDEA